MADYYVEEQNDDGSLVIAGPFATRAEAEASAARTTADHRTGAGGGHPGEATEIISNGRSYDVIEVDRPTTGQSLFAALQASGFIGMWADRADLGATAAFARELRSRAEARE